MLTPRYRARGFNMIEILTAITVLGIVIALGAPAMGEYLQNQQLRAAADAIQNGYQIARAEAIRRNKPVQMVLDAPGTGWTVSEVGGGTIQSRSAQEGSSNASAETTPGGTNTVTFTALGGVNAKNGDGSDRLQNVEVRNTTGGVCQHSSPSGTMRCLKIVVSGGGSIRMCDPAVSAPDARACP